MLSQLGKVIVRLRAAEEAFKVGLEAEFERLRRNAILLPPYFTRSAPPPFAQGM